MNKSSWVPLLLLALLSSACGGGSTGGSGSPTPPPASPSTPPPIPGPSGQVVAEVQGPTGPVQGAIVKIYYTSGMNTVQTDASGKALFAVVPPGPASLRAFASGLATGFASVTVKSGERTSVVLSHSIERKATPVFAVKNVALRNSTLSFDVEFAVLDEQGESIETLTSADVDVYHPDCFINDTCTSGPNGEDAADTYRITAGPSGFTFIPAGARSPFVAALLLEHTSAVSDFDVGGQRLAAVRSFFTSMTTDDRVSLGSYSSGPSGSGFSSEGGFTADGSGFEPVLNGLKDPEFGSNSVFAALTDTLAFAATNAPAGPADARRAIVVISPSPPVPHCSGPACASLASTAAESRRVGFPVFAIAPDITSRSLGQLVASSGGTFIDVDAASQYAAVGRALGRIIGGGLARYRLHLELELSPLSSRSGHAALVYLVLTRPERLDMYIPVPIP